MVDRSGHLYTHTQEVKRYSAAIMDRIWLSDDL